MEAETLRVEQAKHALDAPEALTALGVLEKVSWVQCDRCDKWRKLSGVTADALEEDVPWCGRKNVIRAACEVFEFFEPRSRNRQLVLQVLRRQS